MNKSLLKDDALVAGGFSSLWEVVHVAEGFDWWVLRSHDCLPDGSLFPLPPFIFVLQYVFGLFAFEGRWVRRLFDQISIRVPLVFLALAAGLLPAEVVARKLIPKGLLFLRTFFK